jgi:hypothetical protein
MAVVFESEEYSHASRDTIEAESTWYVHDRRILH